MYEEWITLKPDSPKSHLAKRQISPALSSHARLVNLLLNSSTLAFLFRSGKSVILPTMHLQMTPNFRFWLAALCRLLAVGRLLHWNFGWFWCFLHLIFVSWINMEIQTHKRIRKAKFSVNKVKSFVRRSGIWTCDVFTANNQAVTNPVKRSMGYNYCQNQCLWGSETLSMEG